MTRSKAITYLMENLGITDERDMKDILEMVKKRAGGWEQEYLTAGERQIIDEAVETYFGGELPYLSEKE